jgi:Tetracyclin repressor-like, C-terminal domain
LRPLRAGWKLFKAYLDVLEAGGLREPAAVLRPVISYAVGYGYAERSMLGVQCQPHQRQALVERELLLSLAKPCRRRPHPSWPRAAVAVIADCDPDRCFEEGLALMLAGLTASPGTSRKRRDHQPA